MGKLADLGSEAAMEGESIQPVWQAGIKATRLTPPLPAGLVHQTEGGLLAAHIGQSHLCAAPHILQSASTQGVYSEDSKGLHC